MEQAPSQGPDASVRAVGGEGVLTATPAELLAAAEADADRTIDLRRRLHRHPELGLHLPRTQATVLEAFGELPIELTTGRSTTSRGSRISGTSRQRVRGGSDRVPNPRPDVTAHPVDEQRPHPNERLARDTDRFHLLARHGRNVH